MLRLTLALCVVVAYLRIASCELLLPGTLSRNNSNDTLRYSNVFSALHDPVVGQVRVFLELHPKQLCLDISVCRFPDTQVPDQPAVPSSPFGKYLDGDQVEPLECFLTCKLPPGSKSAQLSSIVLLDNSRHHAITWPVERLQTPARRKGWGICCAPVYSNTPQFLDWLSYHEALGAEGIHLYVARTDGRHREMFGRGRSGPPKVTLTYHHLVTYHEYYHIRSEVPSRYYSQNVAVNECVYRHRHLYDYIAVIDRDEFIQVQSAAEPKQANLTAILRAALDGTKHASASMFTGRYSVRCGAARRSLIGPPVAAVPAHMRAEGDALQGYEGYDVFGHDPRTPDFTNCTSHPARVHLHRQCHTKSIVRPALVELQHAHQVMTAVQGYTEVPLPLQRAGVYLKHVQCIRTAGDWTAEGPLCQRTGPVDYTKDAGDGVDVCPQDGHTASPLQLHSSSSRLGAA